LKWFPVINRKVYTIINVEKLADLPAKTEVTLQSLMDAGIVTTNDGPLKILGPGELKVALQVKAAAATKSAIAKIEGAGGSIEILNA
jgi:large subunit ribosomal protein L15